MTFDVTQNPEAQEAESRKYFALGILQLKTGNYAVFGPGRHLIYIGPDPLSCDLTFKPPPPVIRSAVAPKPKLDLSTLLLKLRKP